MKSTFFYEGHQEGIAGSIKEFLNSAPEFLSPRTASSTRATGDAIEELISEQFDTFLEIWPKSVRVRGLYLALSEIAEIADAWKAIRSEGTVGS